MDYGAFAVLLFISAALGVLFIFRYINQFSDQLKKMSDTVDIMGKAIVNEKGNPIATYDVLSSIKQELSLLRDDFEEHSTSAADHYKDVERIAGDEHWKNCSIDKCPLMSNIFVKLDKVLDRFDQFDKLAEDSRKNTSASLDSISKGMRDLSKELSSIAQTIVGVLSTLISKKE